MKAERPTARLWYMASVLSLVNAVGFVDRQSLPLLVLQIEHDLQLSDTEMSLLIGLAFILVFSGMAVPAGMLADRVNRRKLIAGAVALFATATICCAAAFSFLTLFIGRMAVGIGESVNGPGGISMIRDAFPRQWQASAVGIWAMGATIGSAFALLGGGALLALVRDAAEIHLPLIGTIHAWQLVLIASGLVTYPVAALVLTVREPQRPPRRADEAARTMRDALRFLGRHWHLFVPLLLVNGLTIMMGIGFAVWMPALLGRVWHLSRPEIGLKFGLIFLLCSPTSQFAAGFIVDKLERMGIEAVIPKFGLIVCAIVFLPAILAPNAPSLGWLWLLLAIFLLFNTSLFTIGTALVTKVVPPDLSGKISAFHFFIVGVCGTAIAPTLIAVVSDNFYAGPAAIGHAMALVAGALDVAAMACFAMLWGVLRGAGAQDYLTSPAAR
ncbi:MAG TPA: MFS transporter [Stellaceae bacterium]|nr:MFS transporter [Stellaceae bacterium]